MSVRRWAVVGLSGLALCWGGLGYELTRASDAHDYRVAAVRAAQSAYHAVVTARLVVDARLAGRVFGPYTAGVLDDGRKAVAGAAKRFADDVPTDRATVRMRDRLGPLLLSANAGLGAVEATTARHDQAGQRRAADALAPVADQLHAFITEYR